MAHLVGASSMMAGGVPGVPATHLPRFVPDGPPARGWASSTARSPFAVPCGRPSCGNRGAPLAGGWTGSPSAVSYLAGPSPGSSTASSPCASPRSRAVCPSTVVCADEPAYGAPAPASDRSVVLMALASKARGAAAELSLPPPPSRSVSDVSAAEARGRAGGAADGVAMRKAALLVGARKKGAADAAGAGHAVAALKKRVVGRFFGKATAKPRQYAGWEEDTLR